MLDLLGNELEPLLPSNTQCNGTAGSSRQAEHQNRLRVRSRLFSTSEDGLLGASRQVLATSPTNPFDTAEVLGSDSIPSSPFEDVMADDWLHVQDALLDRYSMAACHALTGAPKHCLPRTSCLWATSISHVALCVPWLP